MDRDRKGGKRKSFLVILEQITHYTHNEIEKKRRNEKAQKDREAKRKP